MILKKIFLAVAVCSSIAEISAKELNVLMIGNSFSVCVGQYLPQIVANDPDNELILTSAFISGCSFEQHYDALIKAEKNPKFVPYVLSTWHSGRNPVKGIERSGNINELIKNNQFDVITIQQYSVTSWDFNSFEPYAGELIKYIRKYQKNAEIIIQQTWAYRADSPSLPHWGFNQQEMHDRVSAAYRQLAEKYRLRVIPMGDAVQIFREKTPVKYQKPDMSITYKEPALPSHAGDTVGLSFWRGEKGARYIHFDYSHLNNSGHYMQALLWYSFLFDEPVSKVEFIPENISAEDAELLKECAGAAIQNYKQVGK